MKSRAWRAGVARSVLRCVVGYTWMLVPTQTVWLQLIVLQQTFTWTVRPQIAVKTQVLPPPRPASSLPSSEGEERLWRARTSASKSLSNITYHLLSGWCRTGAEAPVRMGVTACPPRPALHRSGRRRKGTTRSGRRGESAPEG